MNAESLLVPRSRDEAYRVYPQRYFPDYDVPRTLPGYLEYAPTATQLKRGQVCEAIRDFGAED